MSFERTIPLNNISTAKPLNNPQGWEIFELPQVIKTASITKDVNQEDTGGFDIQAEIKKHPEHLYVKIFAIKKDEINDNGDAFSEEELKKAAHTFVGVPFFTNHQNDDIEKAIGKCVHSWYDEKDGGIYIIGRVDKVGYPKIARAIEEEIAIGTSMGTSVEYSLCSVCHKRASLPTQYCSHVSERKNRKFSGQIKCEYHESEDVSPDDPCPLCGSTKQAVKVLDHKDTQIFEHNYGLKFIENSFVVNPACHECGVRCVLHVPNVQKKVASLSQEVDQLVKYSVDHDKSNKESGLVELQALKNSMTQVETVVQSMLQQKENVSMEYVSQLVKVMADIQETLDELTEMGYGRLPSPPVSQAKVSESPVPTEPAPVAPTPATPPTSVHSPPGSNVESVDMGGVGSITKPKYSAKKIEEYLVKINNLVQDMSSLMRESKMSNKNEKLGENMTTDNTKTAASAENREVITEKQLAKEAEPMGNRWGETYEQVTESKEQIGRSDDKDNDTTSTSPQKRLGTYETITEDQMKTSGEYVVRWDEAPEVITEKQWTELSKMVTEKLSSDWTSVITEAQLRDLLSTHRFVGAPETITEDQLKDIGFAKGMERWAHKNYAVSLIKMATSVVADMIQDYHKSPEQITKCIQKIADDERLRNKYAFLSIVNSLPEKKESRKALASNSRYFKLASANKIGTEEALIMAVAENAQFGLKAEDVLDSALHVLESKTAMSKVEDIITAKKDNKDYKVINKQAALEDALKALDRPEDGKYRIMATLEDISAPITDKEAFVKGIQKLAQETINDASVNAVVIRVEVGENGELVVDVQDGAEEGITPEDIDIDVDGVQEGDMEVVEVDESGSVNECKPCGVKTYEKEEDVTKEASEKEDAPKAKTANKREEIVKKAQMLGGEMGGQGGAAQMPGAGAAVPGAPMDAPPVESFSPPMDDMGAFDEDLGEDLTPQPPGSICPVCGSNDVDVVDGKGKCNNCGSESKYKVEIEVTKWKDLTPEADDTEAEDEMEFGEGEGFEMDKAEVPAPMPAAPAPAPMPAMPAAASSKDSIRIKKFAAPIKLTPEIVKFAQENNISIGTISPANGKNNTVKVAEGTYFCKDTGTKYTVSYRADKDKNIWAQWSWTPVQEFQSVACRDLQKEFKQALASAKITEKDFYKLSLRGKAQKIAEMRKNDTTAMTKIASKKATVLDEYKVAFGGWGDKFPMSECIEKLARRWGQDAVCLSGPDEGQNLAESVCKRLKGADVYSNNIAGKIASVWGEGCEDDECVQDQIRDGYTIKDANTICKCLKAMGAEPVEFLADELAEVDVPEDIDVVEIDEVGVDEDPFGEDVGSVMLELPIELVEELNEALDKAIGEEGIAEEAPVIDEEPIVDEAPVEDVGIEDTVDETVDEAVEIEEPPIEKEETIDAVEEDVVEEDLPTLEAEEEGEYKTASSMKSKFGGVGKMNMDLSSVLAALQKNAAEKQISQQNVQDSEAVKPYSAGENGSLMGHEGESVSKGDRTVQVPRNQATMGKEEGDANPQDKPQPSIPSDKGTMGHEDEVGLSGGDSRYTGGDEGSGKTRTASAEEDATENDADLLHMRGFGSSQQGLTRLAEQLSNMKQAGEKKVNPKKPVADDKDIQPIKDNGTIGKEEKFTADKPENTEGSGNESQMGHENETLGDVPKEPKDQPSIPADEQLMGGEGEDMSPEKQTNIKGTVIAKDVQSEAYRLAGLMLQKGHIKSNELQSKVTELQTYKLAQLKDLEKAMFQGTKGLNTVSDGLERPVIIKEESSLKEKQGNGLVGKLQGLFSLERKNQFADTDEESQLRKVYK